MVVDDRSLLVAGWISTLEAAILAISATGADLVLGRLRSNVI